MMVTLLRTSRKQAGWDFPWFIAQATYHMPDDPACPPIREAQQSLWQPDLAIAGPDTDTLTAPYRQTAAEEPTSTTRASKPTASCGRIRYRNTSPPRCTECGRKLHCWQGTFATATKRKALDCQTVPLGRAAFKK